VPYTNFGEALILLLQGLCIGILIECPDLNGKKTEVLINLVEVFDNNMPTTTLVLKGRYLNGFLFLARPLDNKEVDVNKVDISDY